MLLATRVKRNLSEYVFAASASSELMRVFMRISLVGLLLGSYLMYIMYHDEVYTTQDLSNHFLIYHNPVFHIMFF